LWAAPPRPPASRVEDDANLPEDDDPWLDEDEPDSDDEDQAPKPKRPFWNR
jgi:hypothetical protein